MPHVMTRADRPGAPFRRRIGVGKASRLLVFTPGKPIQVTAAQLKLLEPDLGVHLIEVNLDERGRPRPIRRAPSAEQTLTEPPEETPPET